MDDMNVMLCDTLGRKGSAMPQNRVRFDAVFTVDRKFKFHPKTLFEMWLNA